MNKSQHPLYLRWYHIMHRCYDDSFSSYHLGGGVGLDVCPEWHNFWNFAEFIETNFGLPRYYAQLGRKDPNIGWYPGNIIGWVGQKQVARNRRDNALLKFRGKTQSIAQWADDVGIDHATLRSRIEGGWTIKDTLTILPDPSHRLYNRK